MSERKVLKEALDHLANEVTLMQQQKYKREILKLYDEQAEKAERYERALKSIVEVDTEAANRDLILQKHALGAVEMRNLAKEALREGGGE
ncbi:hypothetical protein [Salicibibacter kimchii]|uniref:DUF2508 family protein n=1 Tax=Salicibibacter kimchii TaxID=2099786 RepID=A0A345BUH8_9BACI|nr:hypothetical protein [Salicibibacter kimchii]AXF54609.1 hypothetical protein DT065_00315 [Salicibibacter kimchii]